MKKLLIGVVVLVLGFAAYVRLVPVDPDRWNVMPNFAAPGDYPETGGFEAIRQITTTPLGMLEAVDRVAMATPRTIRIAGTPEAGLVTYQTRSALWGFPDYTTVSVEEGETGPVLQIHGRLQFGYSDAGVNEARVRAWLAALGPLVVTPDTGQ
jgi:uncharacterized protein (DUF1499 family)